MKNHPNVDKIAPTLKELRINFNSGVTKEAEFRKE